MNNKGCFPLIPILKIGFFMGRKNVHESDAFSTTQSTSATNRNLFSIHNNHPLPTCSVYASHFKLNPVVQQENNFQTFYSRNYWKPTGQIERWSGSLHSIRSKILLHLKLHCVLKTCDYVFNNKYSRSNAMHQTTSSVQLAKVPSAICEGNTCPPGGGQVFPCQDTGVSWRSSYQQWLPQCL